MKEEKPKKRRDLHSRSYRRYFRGHEELGHLDEKGRVHIERVYHGKWIVQTLPRAARIRERITLALLYALAAAAFVAAALRGAPGNRSWYVSAAHVLSFALLAWTLSGLFNYLNDSERMTEGEYRCGAARFRLGCLLSAGALGLCVLLYLLCAALFSADRGAHLLCAALCLGGALALLLARRIDAAVPFETVGEEELSLTK